MMVPPSVVYWFLVVALGLFLLKVFLRATQRLVFALVRFRRAVRQLRHPRASYQVYEDPPEDQVVPSTAGRRRRAAALDPKSVAVGWLLRR